MNKKIIILVVMGAMVSLGFLAKEVTNTQKESQKLGQELVQTATTATDLMQQIKDDPSKKAELFTLSGTEKNATDVMSNLSKQYINAILTQTNEYRENYQKLGLNTLLSGKRLLKDKDMRESYAMLNQAKALSQAQILRFSETQHSFKSSIQTTNLNDADKQKMLSVLEPKLSESKANFTTKINLEINSIEQFEKAIEILSHREKWAIEGDDPVFKTDADLNKYNGYMLAIQANSKHGKEIDQKIIDTSRQKINQLSKP